MVPPYLAHIHGGGLSNANGKITGQQTSGRPSKADKRELTSPSSETYRGSPDRGHPKRQKMSDSGSRPTTADTDVKSPALSTEESRRHKWAVVADRSSDTLMEDWAKSPYATDRELVEQLMECYFTHISSATYCMFVDHSFMRWLRDDSYAKSLDDTMLIYTMLAVGCVFSPHPQHKQLGVNFARISRYAVDHRHFSLQLVQSRMLLAVYYFATNNPEDSWDYCGSAFRAASGMKLNLELDVTEEADMTHFPLGLSRHGYAECRRRTFYSCYILDRFNGFCSGHMSIIHPEDVFLRLPCSIRAWEVEAPVSNPYFDPVTPALSHAELPDIGSMAYLINIVSIWGDVMATIYRTINRPETHTPAQSSAFHAHSMARLQSWRDSLPEVLQYSVERMDGSSHYKILGTWVTMHAVYHTTQMKLNRYMGPARELSAKQLACNRAAAAEHAHALLDMMNALSLPERTKRAKASGRPVDKCTFSTPFVGFSIISAVDIVTEQGLVGQMEGVLRGIRGARRILEELSHFWRSARLQTQTVSKRIEELEVLSEDPRLEKEGGWRLNKALERTFANARDCFYVADVVEPWKGIRDS